MLCIFMTTYGSGSLFGLLFHNFCEVSGTQFQKMNLYVYSAYFIAEGLGKMGGR